MVPCPDDAHCKKCDRLQVGPAILTKAGIAAIVAGFIFGSIINFHTGGQAYFPIFLMMLGSGIGRAIYFVAARRRSEIKPWGPQGRAYRQAIRAGQEHSPLN